MTNFIVYDLETHNTERARPFCSSFYRLSKLAGRYDRDPTKNELEKSLQDTIAFAGDKCNSNALDYCLKSKGEEYKTSNKVFEYNLQMHAHNGSGFDTWTVLNNLDCGKRIVNVIKNGKRIIELIVFNGYIGKSKRQIPQYLHFRCGMTHFYSSLKKSGKTFKLPKPFWKTEMNHDDIDGNKYEDKKIFGYLMSKWMFYLLLIVMLDILKLCKKSLDFQ